MTPRAGHDMGHLHSEEMLRVNVSAQHGQVAGVSFTPTEPGANLFGCTIPGHPEAGMLSTRVAVVTWP